MLLGRVADGAFPGGRFLGSISHPYHHPFLEKGSRWRVGLILSLAGSRSSQELRKIQVQNTTGFHS